MNIGFVSSWLERGATYVTKNYIDMLIENHNIFVFARAGEYFDSDMKYKNVKITMGYRLDGTRINWKQFEKWIKDNSLEMVIFNEQSEIDCVYRASKKFPELLLGAYIDYYKEDTIDNFKYYHFLLCNTKRHYSVFDWHPGAFYLPWGLDINTFKMSKINKKEDDLVFFHSMGMSQRKGTRATIKGFIKSRAYERKAKLVIHTQCNINELVSKEECEKYNIEVIKKTVPHPGLYYLGDVYIYPTTLDGLGLTIYEALSCGLPVITTNEAPMNEVISNENGYLVNVESYHCRKDAYYWPLAFVSEDSLVDAINYYVENIKNIEDMRFKARNYAEQHLNFKNTKIHMNNIIENILAKKEKLQKWVDEQDKPLYEEKKIYLHNFLNSILPDNIASFIRKNFEEGRHS